MGRSRIAAREPGSKDCWVCRGSGMDGAEGDECQACDGSAYLTPGEQERWTCPEGMHMVKDPVDGWQHADGSIGCDDREGTTVLDVVRARNEAAVARKKRIFGLAVANDYNTSLVPHGTRGRGCTCCGTGDHACGSECLACDGTGHAQGENGTSCLLPHNPDCRCPHRHATARPWKRIFGPTYGLDHRLFDGEHLKPLIHDHLMWQWHSFCEAFGLLDPDKWSIVYFSGSEASEWTGADLEGNNDFDVLVGIDLGSFLAEPRNDERAQQMEWERTVTGVAEGLTEKLKATLADPQFRLPGSADTGDEFDQTWFVNPDSYHIADIKPYAAYDVTHDRWAVKPPHLPGWSIEEFPEGPGLEEFCWGFEDAVRAVLDMPEPYRHQEGFALWHYVHDTRSNAFGPQGEGWYDVPNVLEKWLDQKGLMNQLWTLMHEATDDPHLLDAPADWSNTPVLAHLITFNDPRWPEHVALRCVGPKDVARIRVH